MKTHRDMLWRQQRCSAKAWCQLLTLSSRGESSLDIWSLETLEMRGLTLKTRKCEPFIRVTASFMSCRQQSLLLPSLNNFAPSFLQIALSYWKLILVLISRMGAIINNFSQTAFSDRCIFLHRCLNNLSLGTKFPWKGPLKSWLMRRGC